jgi:hypothetical protein
MDGIPSLFITLMVFVNAFAARRVK